MIRSLRLFPISTAVCLFMVGGASGQFVVTASSPSHGDVDVPTSTTFSITFSAPVDTTARFYPDDNFFLAIETYPEIPEPVDMGLSPDLTSFFVEVVLEPDTQYMVWMTGAKSQSGQPLAQPFVATFTTGSALPTGSVSGTVTDASVGKVAEGTLVALFGSDSGPFADGAPHVATIAGPGGQYTIDYVGPGTYQAVAAGDANEDGLLEIQLGDTFGMYDNDGDGLLDAIDVADGQSLSGIDITVRIPAAVSAQANSMIATSIAKGIYSDAELVAVSGQLQPSGVSTFWAYVFYSASNLQHFGLTAVGGQFIESPIEDLGGGVDLFVPLPGGWLDSDVVAGIANDHGAEAFVEAWPFVDIFGFAGNVGDPYGKMSAKQSERDRGVFGLSMSNMVGMTVSAGDQATTPTPLWALFYDGYDNEGSGDFLYVVIHAETGDIDPPLAYYTSARQNLDVANAAATAWATSARLVGVRSGQIGVHRAGVSSDWTYHYRSTFNTAYSVRVREGELLEQGAISLVQLRSTQFLPDAWVDTPQASGTADAESNGFRDQYPGAYVEAELALEIDFNNPNRPVWEFQYWDNFGGFNATVLIDASTGQVVGSEDAGELPTSLRLDQNYPNPFNPATRIDFEVPTAGVVRLTIFDLLGRQVRRLLDADHTPGRYTVVWDGTDDNGRVVSSGIYMYKVESDGTSQTRSMTLLR